jgi:RNA polymerase sigma factor (sigma-70 family)
MLGVERIDEIAQEARARVVAIARRGGPCDEPYIRTVVANATRRAAQREAQSLKQLPVAGDATEDEPSDALDVWSSATASLTREAVTEWLRDLAARFQAVYDLIYVQEHTQREAAAIIGISQPRVAQLHRALLRRGRIDLARFVA